MKRVHLGAVFIITIIRDRGYHHIKVNLYNTQSSGNNGL